jgi:hypothetical protein
MQMTLEDEARWLRILIQLAAMRGPTKPRT